MDIDLLRKDECQPLTQEQIEEIKAQTVTRPKANVNIVPYHIYSPTERVVGEWQEEISGVLKKKPVYEKRITTTTPNKDTDKYEALDVSIDTVIDYNAMFHNVYNGTAGAGQWMKCGSLTAGGFSSIAMLIVDVYPNDVTSGTPNAVFIRHNVSGWGGKSVNITVQYTKTTDEWQPV